MKATMHAATRRALTALALAATGTPASADGELSLRVDGPRVRLSYSLPLEPGTQLGVERVRVRLGALSLYDTRSAALQRPALSEWSVTSDYRFRSDAGWRATGGLLRGESLDASSPASGLRNPHDVAFAPDADRASVLDGRSVAVPYLGLGYSGRANKAWSWHADLGVVMLKPRSSVRLGADGAGSRLSYDTAGRDPDVRLPGGLGDWRVSPVMQLGVSYAF
ncbi:MAG TPA: hypothetical protein VNO84_18300 [Burkholderiaceae bacterium]|nr:hypothetical protein [Burkholderiaceae bacterium]